MGAAPRTFYLIAIGGTAMAPLASLLKEKGNRVLGSDGPLYPPMSDRLEALGIEVRPAWDARNLPEHVDEVVVGNLAGRDNPELCAALSRGLRVRSMPETLHEEVLAGRHSVVVTGTHGKTTTTALVAWLLSAAGRRPGFLVGGEPLNFDSPAALGSGEPFVIEGDEYSTSFSDKGPKFLHYAPRTLVITSVEHDHADLYPDLDAVKDAFRKAVGLVPADGLIVASGDDSNLFDVLQGARARIVLYRVENGPSLGDEGPEADLLARSLEESPAGCRFSVRLPGKLLLPIALPVWGRHNVANALAAIGVSLGLGLTPGEITGGLASFRGVRRRLEEKGTASSVTVVDDFAHHPTAVEATLKAARARWPMGRLWAVFEPRSLTACRADFAPAYRKALALADGVVVAAAYHAARLSRNGGPGALDTSALAEDLHADGRIAFAAQDADAIVKELLPRLSPGDVVVGMSSGSFGGFHGKLLDELTLTAQDPVHSSGKRLAS